MNFLKNLFGGSRGGSGDKRSLRLYVRPKRCDRLVEVRIDLYNDLSQEDDGKGYFVRKIAQAARCPFPAELYLQFDGNRRLVEQSIENGEFVTEEEYQAWLAEQETAV
jgi:hypothetical protein